MPRVYPVSFKISPYCILQSLQDLNNDSLVCSIQFAVSMDSNYNSDLNKKTYEVTVSVKI